MKKKSAGPAQNRDKISPPRTELAAQPAAEPREYDLRLIAAAGLLVSLLLLAFSYLYFGSYFEMNDDPRYVMAMKGFASPLPYANFVSVYKFTVNIYIALYERFPGIAWYGLSMFLLLWGGLFNLYLTLYLAAKKRLSFPLILALFIAFYFLVFFQNAYLINFTRPSLLATSSFVLLLGALYLDPGILRNGKWILVFPALTYMFGHCTRLDAGHLGLVFGLAAVLPVISLRKKTGPFLAGYMLPVLIFVALVKSADYYSQKTTPGNAAFLEKTELLRQLFDYRNASAYVPGGINDTIAYNALMIARYANDDKVVSADFIKKLTKSTPLLEGGSGRKFREEFGAFTTSLAAVNAAARNLNYSLFLVLFAWFLSAARRNLAGFIKYSAFQAVFILILTGMSYYMKLPARVFNPLLVLFTFSNILFALSLLEFREKKFYYLLLLPLAAALFSLPGYARTNAKTIADYRAFGKVNHLMMDDMNSTFRDTVFIPTNLRSWEMHNATDPLKELNFRNNNSYVYLTIELSIVPETQDQLVSKFGTHDHARLFKRISEMDNVVFISEDSFNDFLRTYYYYLYDQDYYFEKATAVPPPFYRTTGLNYFRLRKRPGPAAATGPSKVVK